MSIPFTIQARGGMLGAALALVGMASGCSSHSPFFSGGFLAPAVDSPAAESPDVWRRTVHGWEDIRTWPRSAPAAVGGTAVAPRPLVWGTDRFRGLARAWGQVHPAAVAMGQLIFSLWGLRWSAHFGAPAQRLGWRSRLAASFRASAFY